MNASQIYGVWTRQNNLFFNHSILSGVNVKELGISSIATIVSTLGGEISSSRNDVVSKTRITFANMAYDRQNF